MATERMMAVEKYLAFLNHILEHGAAKDDRTGTGTISTFGYQMRFDLGEGFPLLTTKRVHFPSIVHELLWFISGDTNIRYLVKNGVRIWNEWPYERFKKSSDYAGESLAEFAAKVREDADFAEKHGDLGPVYGKQWRAFSGGVGEIDQLQAVIETMKKDPSSRRLVVNSWNPAVLDEMALPPCHMMYQFYINDGKLSCQLYQRSADAFLGVPFNIASYALLTMMVAKTLGLEPHEFIHTIGDAHIYNNHREQVKKQLARKPRPLPRVVLAPVKSLFDYTFADIKLEDYDPHPAIRAEVSV